MVVKNLKGTQKVKKHLTDSNLVECHRFTIVLLKKKYHCIDYKFYRKIFKVANNYSYYYSN